MINPIADWLTLDDQGIQMPWYTRPCLEWLDTLDLKRKSVFEYGVGNSTKWYHGRGALCFGVESIYKWVDYGREFAEIEFRTDRTYLTAIEDFGNSMYDLIIIDGEYRDECTAFALAWIRPGGILIIDNWDQPSVEPNDWTLTKELIKDMKQVVYKEPTHADWSTLVVFP